MRLLLASTLLIAACGTGTPAGNGREDGARPVKAAVQTANLTGLYETEAGAAGSQMCAIDRGAGDVRFGLVRRGDGNCGGAGHAVRRGDALVLVMEGDEACEIAARIADRQVTFPDALPAGCSYYCAPGASLAGLTLDKLGGTAEDAARATDLVGDPLCG